MTNTNPIEATTLTTESTEPAERSTACCGGPAVANPAACCALDETVKAAGAAGCGCGARAAAAPTTSCC
jgi:hypothetical protein